jgi:hypothetical protein
MRTKLRGKVTLLFMTLGLLLAVPAVALADNIQDNIQDNVNSALQLTAGDANSDKTAEIMVVGNNAQQDPDAGCNFDTATESLTISFTTPSGVTATALDGATANAGEMKFTACGVNQTVKLSASSSATPGDYTVTANIVNNNTGTRRVLSRTRFRSRSKSLLRPSRTRRSASLPTRRHRRPSEMRTST